MTIYCKLLQIAQFINLVCNFQPDLIGLKLLLIEMLAAIMLMLMFMLMLLLMLMLMLMLMMTKIQQQRNDDKMTTK